MNISAHMHEVGVLLYFHAFEVLVVFQAQFYRLHALFTAQVGLCNSRKNAIFAISKEWAL